MIESVSPSSSNLHKIIPIISDLWTLQFEILIVRDNSKRRSTHFELNLDQIGNSKRKRGKIEIDDTLLHGQEQGFPRNPDFSGSGKIGKTLKRNISI